MLSENQSKEAISRAYLSAVAACIEGSTTKPDADMDSVDAVVQLKVSGSTARFRVPGIAFQLKSTEKMPDSDPMSFFLKKKNYDDLLQESMQPRLLLVVYLLRPLAEVVQLGEEGLLLACRGYWLSLYGCAPTVNESGETVYIPKGNVLTPETLLRLLRQAARAEVLG